MTSSDERNATEAGDGSPLVTSRRQRSRAATLAFMRSHHGFDRLAVTHGLMTAGDALVAMALAGSLFFSIDPSDARWRVALYLILTLAPFAAVAPLLGPVMDRARGGHRLMIIGSAIVRAIVALFMIRDLDGLLLFPEAFAMLVLGKSYQIAKSALVPTTVGGEDELVKANSHLSLISGGAGFVAAIPGLLLLRFGGPEFVVALAAVVFAAAGFAASRIPATVVASEAPDAAELAELRSSSIRLGAIGMGVLRGIVGFLTFLLAFSLRGGAEDLELGGSTGAGVRQMLGGPGPEATGAPTWHFGVVVGMGMIGGVAGSYYAPRLRRRLREESIIIAMLVTTGVAGFTALAVGGLIGATVMAGAVGLGAASAKQAFDAIVQRDAPEANRGQAFARFETRFQLAWVVGAFLPVAVRLPSRVGFGLIAIAALAAAINYVRGARHDHQPLLQPTGAAPGPSPVAVPQSAVPAEAEAPPVMSRIDVVQRGIGVPVVRVEPDHDERPPQR